MKKLILLVLFIHCSFTISNAQWVSANGPYGATILCLANSGTNVFAGTYQAGLFLTTNNGTNWSAIGFANQSVYSLASNGTYLFAGTSAGISRSSNNGANWTTVYNSATIIFKSLALNGSFVFAGTNGFGILRSTNNGDNWTYTALSDFHVSSILVCGANLFAATNGGVFLSTDNGVNWFASNNGLLDLSANILAASGINLFVGTTGGGIFISSINGGNWTTLNNGLTNWYIRALTVSESNTFIANSNGVFLSKNPGSTWINRNQGFGTVPAINTLLIANNYIFAGTVNQSIWRRSLTEIITGTENISKTIPESYSLKQNYPNPFNPTTKIKFDVAKFPSFGGVPEGRGGFVTLKVYDVTGREVETLVNETLQPGTYETTFDGSKLNSGVYFYKLITNGFTETKKMLMIK
jgi:hypothetical protein